MAADAMTRLTARVPATSANLGAGFDAFGLALDLCNEVTLETDGSPGVSWEGEGAAELPTDGSDLVSSTIRRLAPDAPAFSIHGVNRIPLERGLGSSSAAIVAGVALGCALARDPTPSDPSEVFRIAAEIEGHPDNVAAAAYGGFTIVVDGRVERFDPHPDVRPVVLVPERARISTEEARRRLPREVPLDDAVSNGAHAGLTAAALVARPGILGVALGDRLHERARLSLVPEVEATFERLRAAGIAVCVSGSGPALLAFEGEGATVDDPGEGWRVLRVGVRSSGIELLKG